MIASIVFFFLFYIFHSLKNQGNPIFIRRCLYVFSKSEQTIFSDWAFRNIFSNKSNLYVMLRVLVSLEERTPRKQLRFWTDFDAQ